MIKNIRANIKIIHIYILKEFIASFFFGIAVFSLLLLLDRIFDLASLFLSKGVSLFSIIKLFAFIYPNILPFAIPMSILFAVLLAYGRLSEDNEITAMKANSMDYKTLTLPVIIPVCIISFLLIFFNSFISPFMQSRVKNIFQEIITQRPFVTFPEKTIIRLNDHTFYINKVDRKNNILEGVSIYKFNTENKDEENEKFVKQEAETNSKNNENTEQIKEESESKTSAALSAGVAVNDTESIKEEAGSKTQNEKAQAKESKKNLTLNNGDISWRISASSATVQVYTTGALITLYAGFWQKANSEDLHNMIHMTFNSYKFFMSLTDQIEQAVITPQEINSFKLLEKIKELKKEKEPYSPYVIEFWVRLLFATAPIAFVLTAMPIGIMAGKGGKAIGFGLSIGLIVVYYMLLVIAMNSSEKNYNYAGIILWFPNVFMTLCGIFLFTKMIKK